MKKAALLILVCLFRFLTGSEIMVMAALQQDTLRSRELETLVVTATRQERSLEAVPMPVTVIKAATLRTMGSLRLQDALAEQTGLVVVPQVNGQGNGLQLQGFNPDYTLILIDGEPLVGRYTGSLELSRIAVGNIRQIEIVKGPSSSLYGSEALAGVVNIITEKPTASRAEFSARYGTNNTSDLSAQGVVSGSKFSAYLFGDRYSTSGYDLSPKNFGKTVSPFFNNTLQARITWKPGVKTEAGVSARYFKEQQQFSFEVMNSSIPTRTTGTGTTHDWSVNPVVHHRFSDHLKLTARLYLTTFRTSTGLYLESGGDLYYSDHFNQQFTRPETVLSWYVNKSNMVTAGTGLISESVRTSRYGDEARRNQQTAYAFVQHEWTPGPRVTVIAGARFDRNNVFGNQASPKLSASYRLSDRVLLKASTGVGFKAPDFRQLYFNFNNSAAGGYSVLGSEVVADKLAALDAAGQISTYFFNPLLLGKLSAERSLAFNGGIETRLSPTFTWNLNLFRNTVNNLVETQAVASTVSGQNIYTYRNIRRAFTEGAEAGLNWKLNSKLELSAGYQLLFAMDRDVLDNVRNGNAFWRNPETLITRRLKTWEYHGLYNRSRHTANLKLFYRTTDRWEGSMRIIYRSRFGIGDIRGNIQGETIPPSDINSNALLDRYDRFVSGYALINVSLAKELKNGLRLQGGIDNLFNHREPVFIPNLPGRLVYLSCSWKISFDTNHPIQ